MLVPVDDEHAVMTADMATVYPHAWVGLPQSPELRHASRQIPSTQRPPRHWLEVAHKVPFKAVPVGAVQYAV